MTRPALTAPPTPRTGRPPFRWPNLRRNRTTVALIRTGTVVVDRHQYNALLSNPDVEIVHARAYGFGRAKLVVRYPDRAAPAPKRQAPIAFEWNRPALRAAREIGTAVGMALTWMLAVAAAVTVVGGLIWNLFGDELTAAGRILLITGGSAAALIALVWLLSAKAGICPGLHCPGCPHH